MKGRAEGVVYFDFNKFFGIISCSILAAKLVRSGLSGQYGRWKLGCTAGLKGWQSAVQGPAGSGLLVAFLRDGHHGQNC